MLLVLAEESHLFGVFMLGMHVCEWKILIDSDFSADDIYTLYLSLSLCLFFCLCVAYYEISGLVVLYY